MCELLIWCTKHIYYKICNRHFYCSSFTVIRYHKHCSFDWFFLKFTQCKGLNSIAQSTPCVPHIAHVYHQGYMYITKATCISPKLHVYHQGYMYITKATCISPRLHVCHQGYMHVTKATALPNHLTISYCGNLCQKLVNNYIILLCML